MDGRTRGVFRRGELAAHCLLVETRAGLVLVDTGFGLRDVTDAESRLSRLFLTLNSPDFREEMTAVSQVARLGFAPSDVRHIVLTHLDFDHAGGLDDFPGATVHLLAAEERAALAQATWLDRRRYRPQQWSTISAWRSYTPFEGEPWFGFDCVRALDGLPEGDLLLVPLIGHTLGHAGVAVRGEDGWLLLAGDAYFYHLELDPLRPRCTPGLRLYQTMMQKNRRARLWNQARLRELRRDHGDEVEIFCSHDPVEMERLASWPLNMPAEPHRGVSDATAPELAAP